MNKKHFPFIIICIIILIILFHYSLEVGQNSIDDFINNIRKETMVNNSQQDKASISSNMKTGDIIFSIMNLGKTDLDFLKKSAVILQSNFNSYYFHISIVVVEPSTGKPFMFNTNYDKNYCEFSKKMKTGIQMLDIDKYFDNYDGIGIYYPSKITLDKKQNEFVWEKCVELCKEDIPYIKHLSLIKLCSVMLINRNLLSNNFIECNNMICYNLAVKVLSFIDEISPEFHTHLLPKTDDEDKEYGRIINTKYHPYCVLLNELVAMCDLRYEKPMIIYDGY